MARQLIKVVYNMKIRNGFVSNSSSSSFCILGIVIKESHGFGDNINTRDTCLSIEHGIDTYYDDMLIGAPPSEQREDETLKEFKMRIVAELHSIVPGVCTPRDLDWHIDGGHDS